MNLKIDVLLNFTGSEEELDNFIADIGEVLIEWGYGNHEDGEAKSLLIVNDFSLETEQDYNDWLEIQQENGAFFALPVEGEDA